MRRHRSRYRRRMRRLALVGLVLLLAGCVPAPAASPSSPTPTPAAPVFASEEEALAAAEQAYAAYLALADTIGQEGGSGSERARALLSPSLANEEIAGFENLAEQGLRTLGATSYSGFTAQSVELGSSTGFLTAYVCSDVSGVDVIDGSGVSVVTPDRADKIPFVVTFDQVDGSVLLGSKTVWTGGGVCV